MKEIQPMLMRGFDASYFEELCTAILDPDSFRIPEISAKDCPTDLFAHATEDDREAALALFPQMYTFTLSSFRLYLEEELDLRINDGLLRLSGDRKSEIIHSFGVWQRAECLVRFFTDTTGQFNPLHIWEWCDGLAVMHVQNEQKLREEFMRLLLQDVFAPAGMTVERFISLQPADQHRFCERHENLMAEAFQALDSRFPRETKSEM